MKTYWEKTTGGLVDYVQIEAEHVLVGSHQGSGHSDSGGRASFAEFLDGRLQDVVSAKLGPDVLGEVIGAVRRRIQRP